MDRRDHRARDSRPPQTRSVTRSVSRRPQTPLSFRQSVSTEAETCVGTLYLLATLIGTLGLVVAFYDPINFIANRIRPSIVSPITALCLSCSFALKLPYMMAKNAILPQIVIATWSVGWLIVSALNFVAFGVGEHPVGA